MNIKNEESLVHTFSSVDYLADTIAKQWLELSRCTGVSHIALSGGSTPKHVFGYIAHSEYASKIVWKNLHFWWGDERCVPATNEQSNYGEAMRLLFSQVLIPANNLHPIHGELGADKALIEFKDELSACFPDSGLPVFDWVLLGLGEDGHTASLFPGQTDYELKQSAVVAIQPESKQERISLSAQAICSAKRVTFIATGEAKAEVVNEVLNEEDASINYPAAHIFSHILASSGCVDWYLDQASASLLN